MRFSYKFLTVAMAMLMVTGIANGQQKIKGHGNLNTGLAPVNHQSTLSLPAADKAPHAIAAMPAGSRAMFDLLFSFPIPSPLATGVETDGSYFYASLWNGNNFYRYTLAGALVDSFAITGVSGIRDLAYDGHYFYGGAASTAIYQMDFTTHTLVSTINCPTGTAVRHIAYDSDHDAFWVGNWDDDFKLISRTGTVLQTIPAATHALTGAYGSAWDPYSAGGPYLWIYDQGGNGNDLVQLNATTGAPTGVTFDVTTVVTTTSGIAGGCFISNLINPTKAIIGGVIQNETVWGLELATLYSANDVSPVQLVNPLSSNVLTASDSIKVKVVNNDTLGLSHIPISYVIDGGTVVNDTIMDTIAGNSNVTFTFHQPYDFSLPGHVYNVTIYTHYASDNVLSNDTLHTTVTNFYDVASTSIDEPAVIIPGTINPLATVKNNSTLTTTFDVTLQIQGGYTSTKTVTSLAPGASFQITFDPWTAALGTYNFKVYTSLAQDMLHTNDTLSSSIIVTTPKKGYIYIASEGTGTAPQGPAYTTLQTPATIVSLADQSSQQFIGAATWSYGNQWLGAVSTDNTLVSIDTLTGARTILGNIGHEIAGMSYDYSTNTLYGVDWDGTNSNLYKISPFNGSATLVGTCGTMILINLACDLTGNLYAVSITDDNLYSINKTTGAVTTIGAIGFHASYAQDMEFDLNSGILYMAAYNADGTSGMRVVNTTTGATTLIGEFAGDAEVTGMAIPYLTTLPSNDIAMVNINGLSSACDLNSTEPVEITVKNMGTTNITSFSASFAVDGGTPVTETVTSTIAPGATYNYTFTGTANLAAAGAHTVEAYVNMTGDTQLWNDTTSITLSQVTPSTVPYAMGFEATDDLSNWHIFDKNADGTTWFYGTTGGNTGAGCLVYSYTSANAANDWAVSTCVQLQAGKTYQFAYFYKVASADWPESMMVHMGTGNTPADLTTMLADHSGITTATYVQNGVNFTVPSDGIYYFGFHCYSDADMYKLYVDDVTITDVTGIKESENEQTVSIYPNPANGLLNIVSGSDLNNIRITNMVGNVVYDNNVNGKEFHINTADFSQGMYFITFKSEAGTSTQKFIVE